MGKLGIYIVEDESLYANQLEMMVDELGYELLGITDNSDTAKKELEKMHPDLILMDVKVNGSMSGIDLAASLSFNANVIFITSFEDEATFNRAKATKPHAYITKPFDSKNLQRTIELVIGNLGQGSEWQEDKIFEKSLFIKNRQHLQKIDIEDIIYLEVEDRYSTVYTSLGKKYVLRMSLGDIQQKLPEQYFMRIHRKYTVNLKAIKSINVQDNMILIGETEIPISRSHKEELLQKLEWLQ